MNIILTGGTRVGSKVISLTCPRIRVAIGAIGVSVLAVLVGCGFWVGRALQGDMASSSDVTQMRDKLLAQQAQLDETEAKAKRDLDALAMQLGELQAQAARLNALGLRLTRMGKLDDGEFNFGELPDVGGPENQLPVEQDFLAPEFSDTLDKLRQQFNAQAEQLGVLETLLVDRDLEAEFMPAGMPVRSGFISSSFGYRVDPISGRRAFHAGVDFDGVKGADVLSVATGVVAFAGRHPAYGNMIDIDHGNGYVTRYAHNDKNVVKVGDVVQAGQLIGKLGATGRATGSHVHFEVWFEGKPINPKKFVTAIR